jgi:hypothetical protein
MKPNTLIKVDVPLVVKKEIYQKAYPAEANVLFKKILISKVNLPIFRTHLVISVYPVLLVPNMILHK